MTPDERIEVRTLHDNLSSFITNDTIATEAGGLLARARDLIAKLAAEHDELAGDRDSAWRVASTASKSHAAIRTRYYDLAEKIGACETDSPSDIAHRLTVYAERLTRSLNDGLRSSERELDAARQEADQLRARVVELKAAPMSKQAQEEASRSVLDPLRARGVLGPNLVDKATPERVVAMAMDRFAADRREIERLTAANAALALAVAGQKVNRQKYAKAQRDAESFGQLVQQNEVAITEANTRISELKHALGTSTRERERMQWNIGNLRAVLKTVAGPVMVYRDVSVHKMTFEQILQRAQQLADDTKQIIEYHSGEFIVMAAPGKRGTASTCAKPELTVDLQVPDEVDLQPVAVGEGTEHSQTMAHLHSTLAVADMMRAALLLAGAPEKGDLTAWASNVRNTIVGLKRDLHEAGQRFLAADSARRSELAEMSAACSNLPFLITPRDLSPIGLLLALRDAALRLHAATVNPAASPPVSGV